MNKAIFLDRDGVINDNSNHYYVYKVEDFKINKGIVESLKKFYEEGYILVLITNQGGVAKGIYTEDDVNNVHNYFKKELAKYDIEIAGVYFCPHHDSIAKCNCRKPSPYMINKAAEDLDIDKSNSYLIGDSPRDIEAAEAAGVRGIKIERNENILKYCELILQNKL